MALPVAVQLYSVRDSVEADMASALRKIKDMGYDGVEFAGLYGHSADYIRGLLDAIGLVPISAHVPLVEMLADPDGTFETYKKIGCRFVAVPYVTEERRPGAEDFFKTIDEIAALGKTAKKYGITLLYHNHDFEFKKVDGEYGLDILYKKVPAEYLQTELDTCWVNVGGENPADYIRKYNGRCEIVHLKDFVGQKSENMYSLIGIKDDGKKADKQCFAFRHLGAGVQNFPEILAACGECDVRWLVIEQDVPTEGLTSLESAEKSLQYLKSL